MAARGVWGKRVLLTVVAGVVTGLGSAVIGLRILEGDAPPRPALSEPEPEPSVEAPARRSARGPRADGMRNGDEGLVGGGAMATRDSVAVVPDLIGRVEGDARRLLERAGFTIGDIMFREDDNPVGTVLQTYPVPGERVTLPATVNLILADRRRVLLPDDSLGLPPDPDSARIITDTLLVRPDSLP